MGRCTQLGGDQWCSVGWGAVEQGWKMFNLNAVIYSYMCLLICEHVYASVLQDWQWGGILLVCMLTHFFLPILNIARVFALSFLPLAHGHRGFLSRYP